MRAPTLLLLAFCTFSVHADIYKFVDDEGNVTYTNIPRPGAKKLRIETPLSLPPVEAPGRKHRHGATGAPRYFPKVDASTQRRRDDMRRQLLIQELQSEQRSLDAARGSMTKALRQPGANLDKLQEAVRMHEKNIELLNEELSHIK
jgi:Domain of unknown function (DUF4124)